MSDISEQERIALFTAMNVSAVTDLATSGVHHMLAPEGTPAPYVIFQRSAPRPGTFAFSRSGGPSVVLEECLWMIKTITDDDTSAPRSPQELSALILTACETAIGSTLTLSAGINEACYRVQDIGEYKEFDNGRWLYHQGFYLRTDSHV